MNIGLIYGFQDILLGKYIEPGTNAETSVVYINTIRGINYTKRPHKIARIIPFGKDEYYAFLDLRNPDKLILYTAIVTDSDIINKLENNESVRLQGLLGDLDMMQKNFIKRHLTSFN